MLLLCSRWKSRAANLLKQSDCVAFWQNCYFSSPHLSHCCRPNFTRPESHMCTLHKEIFVPEIVDSFGSAVTLFTAIKHFTGITDSLYQAQYLLLLGVGTCRPLISPFKLRHLPFVQSLDFYHNILEFTLWSELSYLLLLIGADTLTTSYS